MDKVIIFLVFLGPLVFFHELGHYLFARLFGVRVEVFSIGFGPKILKWTRSGTDYVISLIPLGGYVKMFGDDPLKADELTEEEKKYAFTSMGKWARFWIVFGGPLANFILAFVIYFFLLLAGEKVPEPKLGYIAQDTYFHDLGLRTADTLKKINEYKIVSFDDLQIGDDVVNQITVIRNNEEVILDVETSAKDFMFNAFELSARLRRPIVINEKLEVYYLSLEEKIENINTSLEELFNTPQNVFLHPVTLHTDKAEEKERYVFSSEEGLNSLGLTTIEEMNNQGFYPLDLVVSSIVMNSPADKVGIKKDDILLSLNGESLFNFEDLRLKLQNYKEGDTNSLTILRSGEKLNLEIIPNVIEDNGHKRVAIGIYSSIEFIKPRMMDTPSEGFVSSFSGGLTRTWEAMVKTLVGFKMLVTAEVSMTNIGGPIAIGKVASDSFYISLSMFFRLMALISINLGIINLFPIPVLDGGHILFIGLEILNRGPLSQRKMMMAQQFGLSLLFLLIFFALFNDITRILL